MQFWDLTENVLFDMLILESIVFYGYYWIWCYNFKWEIWCKLFGMV